MVRVAARLDAVQAGDQCAAVVELVGGVDAWGGRDRDEFKKMLRNDQLIRMSPRIHPPE